MKGYTVTNYRECFNAPKAKNAKTANKINMIGLPNNELLLVDKPDAPTVAVGVVGLPVMTDVMLANKLAAAVAMPPALPLPDDGAVNDNAPLWSPAAAKPTEGANTSEPPCNSVDTTCPAGLPFGQFT